MKLVDICPKYARREALSPNTKNEKICKKYLIIVKKYIIMWLAKDKEGEDVKWN